MRLITLFLIISLLAGGSLAAQTKINASTQINWTGNIGSQIHGVANGTAAQDVVTYSQLARVTPQDFGAVANDATEDTSAIQDAIDFAASHGNVTVISPPGTYIAGNIQLRNNTHIVGIGRSIWKLPDGAVNASINGGLVDANGDYPANVIGTTLIDDGDTWYDGGTRAKDVNNVAFIVRDCIIEGLTIDGNRANNIVTEVSENSAAMGAGISLNGACNVTVRDCTIYENTLDGIFLGYSLHGGSDNCTIENNVIYENDRCGIAVVTGKNNKILDNTIDNSGTVGIDVEANLADEVNIGHLIEGNVIDGLHIVSPDTPYQRYITVANNQILANISIGGLIAKGSRISGNRIKGTIFLDPSSDEAPYEPIIVEGNIVESPGYAIYPSSVNGKEANYMFIGNRFIADKGVYLYRPSNVHFIDNYFDLSDDATAAITFLFGQNNVIPWQGNNTIQGNTFDGLSPVVHAVNFGASYIALTENITRINDNYITQSSMTTWITSTATTTFAECNNWQAGTAAPSTGWHSVGEFWRKTDPAGGGPYGWVCTAAGTPGTWKATGNLVA